LAGLGAAIDYGRLTGDLAPAVSATHPAGSESPRALLSEGLLQCGDLRPLRHDDLAMVDGPGETGVAERPCQDYHWPRSRLTHHSQLT